MEFNLLCVLFNSQIKYLSSLPTWDEIKGVLAHLPLAPMLLLILYLWTQTIFTSSILCIQRSFQKSGRKNTNVSLGEVLFYFAFVESWSKQAQNWSPRSKVRSSGYAVEYKRAPFKGHRVPDNFIHTLYFKRKKNL